MGIGYSFALLLVASLLISRINGRYNLILTALPLSVLATRVQAQWPSGLRWVVLAGILLGLPVELRELLPEAHQFWREGWGNLVISGPLFGLLLLWGLLLRCCLQSGNEERGVARVSLPIGERASTAGTPRVEQPAGRARGGSV
jgi:hypothetical protein